MSIQAFYNAATQAPFGSIDRPLYRDVNIGIQRFESPDFSRIYVNVPVDKIFTLNRDDFWNPGDTWRQAVHHLTGGGWGPGTLQYFMQPLLNNSFPAPGSRYELQLAVVGGLCYCTNGNHRLVAGRALLTQLHAQNAEFKLAKVTYYELDQHTKEFVREVVSSGASISTAKVDPEIWQLNGCRYDLYLRRDDIPDVLYVRSLAGIFPVLDERNVIQKFLGTSKPSALGAYDWITTPNDVLNGLLDDAWILKQAGTSLTW